MFYSSEAEVVVLPPEATSSDSSTSDVTKGPTNPTSPSSDSPLGIGGACD